jgi:hypothetical protein
MGVASWETSLVVFVLSRGGEEQHYVQHHIMVVAMGPTSQGSLVKTWDVCIYARHGKAVRLHCMLDDLQPHRLGMVCTAGGRSHDRESPLVDAETDNIRCRLG